MLWQYFFNLGKRLPSLLSLAGNVTDVSECAEQVTRSKPGSSTPPWPLLHRFFPCSSSCPDFSQRWTVNSASVKNWSFSGWVGITDPKAWAEQLAWPLGRGDMKSSTFCKGNNSWSVQSDREQRNSSESVGMWSFLQQCWLAGPGPLPAVLCQFWEAQHSPLHLHRVQRGSGVELEWGQMFCVRGHGVFPPPCYIHVSMLSRVSFPAPGNLDTIHLTVLHWVEWQRQENCQFKVSLGSGMRHRCTPSFHPSPSWSAVGQPIMTDTHGQ